MALLGQHGHATRCSTFLFSLQDEVQLVRNFGCLSDKLAYSALSNPDPGVDGTVNRNFNLMPVHKVDENVSSRSNEPAPLTAAYCLLSAMIGVLHLVQKRSFPFSAGAYASPHMLDLAQVLNAVFAPLPALVCLCLQGQLEIDEAYRKLSKERSNKADVKAHPVKRYEDTRENRVATLANTKIIMDQKRRVSGKLWQGAWKTVCRGYWVQVEECAWA